MALTTQTPTKHTQLLHYTTATGLLGIIEGNFMRATHSGYVNDSTECKAFYDDKLPEIIKCCADRLHTSGVEIAPDSLYDLRHSIIERQNILESYLISFCGSNEHDMENGLLSQWRGYGSDGGYAIVFDTVKLNNLLMEEQGRLSVLNMCEVEYYNFASAAKYRSPVMIAQEELCSKNIELYLRENNHHSLFRIFESVLVMAHMHKHSGFSEEQEVRAVIVPPPKELLKELAEAKVEMKSPPTEHFFERGGLLIPYLKIFDGKQLPISKVIIGPCAEADAERRRVAVDKLLTRHEYTNFEVVKSKIPFIGRS